ncbi:RNA polymerase binding [Pectobacterium bacteriophage PM2]|uniref:RNA polymerase binding protein n=1 Tax=Pectobacterium bacteriophage PM2 TaxID=1429794 RepID=A0A0A0Q2D8_9CAUD|nr:RNA polymerase binding [Pectobacterium bacteriophage PM2]AHY25020.1 RNA polymerase binding protein [Pectobacterium bacteriophage PM2]
MSYITSLAISSSDIQPKNVRTDSNPNNDNKVRRAWVLHCDKDSARKLQSLPQETKFMLYGIIDDDVSDLWIETMRKHIAKSIEAGAKLVDDKIGPDRLEDSYCHESDSHLLQAAEIVAMRIPEFIDSLPAAIKKQMA